MNGFPPNYCPNCGGKDIVPFAPIPLGYRCKECEHMWDEFPPEDTED